METVINSPVGTVKIIENDSIITAIAFTEDRESTHKLSAVTAFAKQELEQYFDSTLRVFTFPFKQNGSEFQQKVWHELTKIPFGQTISYHQLAVNLGDAKSIRAAASANGKNQMAIVVPCHRVIGSNGDLVGYAGGLDKKKWLLQHEGVINQFDIFDQ